MTKFTKLYSGKFHIAIFETINVEGKLRHVHVNSQNGKDYHFDPAVWSKFGKMYPGQVYAALQYGTPGTYMVHAVTHLGMISADKATCKVLLAARQDSLNLAELESYLERKAVLPQENLVFTRKAVQLFGERLSQISAFKKSIDKILELSQEERQTLLDNFSSMKYEYVIKTKEQLNGFSL